MTVVGRMFKRREPVGDAGDVVVLTGAVDVGSVATGPVIEVVIAPAEFGAVPTSPPWEEGDGSSTSLDGDAFASMYRELDSSERAVLAIEQAAEAEAATAASAERQSPWSRS
jgi:hypothetical protein